MFIFILCFSTGNLKSQTDIKTFTYKKGQVLDIIFLNTKTGIEEARDNYFKTAFPVATKYGYTGQGGIGLTESPTQGNYHPEVMVFGVWNDLKGRKDFLANIGDDMPEFHQERRNIWSSFNLTYWEMKNDLTFSVNPDKFNVATLYWEEDERTFSQFKNNWNDKAKKSGGKEVLKLANGDSPFGYHFDPDYLVITEWDSREAFEKFHKENLKMNHDGVKHVNQFIIQ